MIKRLRESDFISSVAMLVSGTIVAQLITYSLSPVISRLYTSEEMSYQSLFLRIVTFISIVATARLELAYNLPKRSEHAFSLVRTAMKLLFATFVVTLIFALLALFVPLKDEHLYAVYLLVPFGVLFLSLFNQGTNLAIREKDFKRISWSKMTQSLANSSLTVVFYSLDFFGSILAYTLSVLLGSGFFFKQFTLSRRKMKAFQLKGRDFAIAKTYADFPRINLPHALVDVTKDLFIAVYMIEFFEKEVLGLYDLSFRMLKIPIVMLGSSIGQVFFKKAIDLKNDNKSIYPLVLKTVRSLFLLSIVPFGVLMVFGEPLFRFVFGDNWARAGYFAQIIAPWLMVNFLVSPISQIPIILKEQKKFFVFGLISAVLLVFCLSLGQLFPQFHWDFDQILWIVSMSQFALSVIILIWLLRLTKKHSS